MNQISRLYTRFYVPGSILLIIFTIKELLNNLTFPSVPRSGISFIILGWINIGYGVIYVGFHAFAILLLLKLSKDYLFSPPYDLLRTSKIEDFNKNVIRQISNRAFYPIVIAFIGAIIPPIFGWSRFAGVSLIVNPSKIPLFSSESESFLSLIPIIGEYSLVSQLLFVPNTEVRILMAVLSGLVMIGFWNLSYLSQIYWSQMPNHNSMRGLTYFSVKWLPYAGLVALLISPMVDTLRL